MNPYTLRAEDFFNLAAQTTVMAPLPHQVWSGIFVPVDVPKLKAMIEADNTYQYWIKIDQRDGKIYIDGIGKDLRKKKDIPPH